jgi:hypothetical protein
MVMLILLCTWMWGALHFRADLPDVQVVIFVGLPICPKKEEILLAYAEEWHCDDPSGFLRTTKSPRIPRKKLAPEHERT